MKNILKISIFMFIFYSFNAFSIPNTNNFFPYFQNSLKVDGSVLAFTKISETLQTDENTLYGLSDIKTIISTAGDIQRETKIFKIKLFEHVYLIEHTYSSATNHTINEDNAFSITETNTQSHRIYYGPADGTTYMVEDYMNIPTVEGYSKDGEMINGGVPINYIWNQEEGFSLGVLTNKPSTFELPLFVNADTVDMDVFYKPKSILKQQTIFGANNNYISPLVFLSINHGDYYQALDQYTKLLEKIDNRKIQNIEFKSQFKRPYWKTWGLDPNASGEFSKDDILAIVETLKDVNINRILLDWGWFTAEGNWEANPDVFDDNSDLENFIGVLNNDGFTVGLWYQPLQIDITDDDVIANLLQYAVRNADNSIFLDDDGLALLNPSLSTVQNIIAAQLEVFKDMGVEHIYLDSQEAQLAIPADFSQTDPLKSHEALSDIYEMIRDFGKNNDIAIEICPDGRSQTILNMPQTSINIGDPKNDQQLRSEFKSLKAIQGSKAIIGTYVDPFSDNKVSGSFLNIVGIGGQLMTMFRNLEDLGAVKWHQWAQFIKNEDLVSAEYLNLYDIGFDYPEAHVVRKESSLFYSFFTQENNIDLCLQNSCDEDELTIVEVGKNKDYSGNITFKGLIPKKAYHAVTFPENKSFTITANSDGEATIPNFTFEKEVLFKVSPVNLSFLYYWLISD